MRRKSGTRVISMILAFILISMTFIEAKGEQITEVQEEPSAAVQTADVVTEAPSEETAKVIDEAETPEAEKRYTATFYAEDSSIFQEVEIVEGSLLSKPE